jgi:hypothetical protein
MTHYDTYNPTPSSPYPGFTHFSQIRFVKTIIAPSIPPNNTRPFSLGLITGLILRGFLHR